MLELKDIKNIDRFEGEWEIFSNFSPCIIKSNGFTFATVEHAFQAAKTKDGMRIREIAQLSASQTGKAKRMGRKVKLIKDWEILKISVMKRLLMQKFSLEGPRNKLLSSGNALIIEGNYWHDNYWGDCYCKKCENIRGLNRLGKLLMEIRKL